ncbi:MAG: lysophospholipid acyltransferase family protein [Deltaproteobacteria bacterium]|nr:lysophospholipid acyltransferase family protein [Deltaproteobacteria bacterium]
MQNEIIYRLILLAVRLMAHIPYRLGQFKGKVLGLLAYMIPMSRKEVALENIRKSFQTISESKAKNLLRRVYMHFGSMLFETPHIMKFTAENLFRYVTFEGVEDFDRAIARGKGVFILTAHFGNWELMAAAVTILWGGTAVVARPADFLPLDRVISHLRSRHGAKIIPKQRAMRQIMEAIKINQIVGILLDQNVDWYEGVFVPFLGRWACTNKGLALIALRTETPVIPAFPVKQKDGRYRIILEKEIKLQRTGDKTADVDANTELFTRVIEKYVKKYPDHWFWWHKRWKTKNSCPLPLQRSRGYGPVSRRTDEVRG